LRANEAAFSAPIIGMTSLSATEADLLAAANLFLDVTTDLYPDGEIGGAIAPK
jgi:hypothetical protein